MERDRSTRRRFLTASSAAALTVGLAGCTSDSEPTDDDGNESTTDDDTNDVDDDGGNDDDEQENEEGGVPPLETQYHPREEYRQPGESLDDFEDIDAWEIVRGEGEADEDIVFDGSQSLRLTSESSENIVVQRDLSDADLTDLDLSFAIRTTTPQNITINVQLVDLYGSQVTLSLREITYRTPDVGWFRSSPGVFEADEIEPMMDELDRIEIQVLHSMEEAEVWIDDLRTHEKPDQGYVLLVWDDGFTDYYDVASPIHDEYDVPTIQAPVPQWTEERRDGIMSVSELQERQEAGDEIVVHGTHNPIHELEDEDEIEARVGGDKRWFIENGLEGADYIVYPFNSFDKTSLEIIGKYHYCGGFNQAGNVNTTGLYGFDPLVLPRTIGHDLDISKRCVDLAAEHNQCTILNFHAFDVDNTMPEDDYEELIQYIADSDIEVITFDDLWTMRTENH
ncbi:polysaccharide deacetylase family protein [Natrialbaceae archaeon A-CW3]